MQFGLRETIVTSLLLGLVAGTYAMVVQPHALARQQRVSEMRSMDAAISAVHTSTEGLEDLAHHVDQQRQATALFNSRLIQEQEITKAVNEVIQTGAANSLQPGNVRMLKRQTINSVDAQPVSLQFSGNFNGFYSFLLQLEEMPRVMRIAHLDISGNGGGGRDGQIQAELTLMMYVDSIAGR